MFCPSKPGFAITLHVPDDAPDGLRIVRKSNRPVVGVVFNQSSYREVAGRIDVAKYFNKIGVYVLVKSPQESSLPTVYVGHGEVKDRLNQHYLNKGWWESAVVFVSDLEDESLNLAHAKHLESRLYTLALEAKRCNLDNDNKPRLPRLSEAEKAGVESLLTDMLTIYPLLGLHVFEKTETTTKPAELLRIETREIKASGYEDAKGFVVVRGSQLRLDERPGILPFLTTLRGDLKEKGVIGEEGQHYVFKQDQVFKSPSTAAGVVLGRSADGRMEWKDDAGNTLKDLQTAAVGRIA